MKYLLLDPKTENSYTGDTLSEFMARVPCVAMDYQGRRLIMFGSPDTVTYHREYSEDEMKIEAYRRALSLLERRGWVLYERRG